MTNLTSDRPPLRVSLATRIAAVLTLACLIVPVSPAFADDADHRPTRHGHSIVDYTESDDIIANPQRGFYHHTETHFRADGTGYTPLETEELRAFRAEGVTQILRVFYLEKFAQTETLDPAWLELVNADFATARDAGVSVIVRFAYAQGGDWPYSPPYGDAPVDVVLAHIEQLTPVLRDNSDVIATMQAGFIGLWGEWYYTDHFVDDPANPGVVTEQDWENRAAVVQALLNALPADRMVQVRTMLMKQTIFNVPTGAEGALTRQQAFDKSDLARVGHHNDCFLASPDDFGTFLSDPIELDQEYLAKDTRFVPMGGETCTVNPPRSEWESASAEMARYHFSYLNRDYNQDVLNSWGADGIAETAKRLGYRFVLEESSISKGGSHHRNTATVRVDIRNEGWAAPYNERPANLILQGKKGTWSIPFTGKRSTPADARTWAPETTTTLAARVCGVPPGRYDAYLELPSADASIAGNPDYSIQTANEGTWVAEQGWNDLGQRVSVNAGKRHGHCVPAVRIGD